MIALIDQLARSLEAEEALRDRLDEHHANLRRHLECIAAGGADAAEAMRPYLDRMDAVDAAWARERVHLGQRLKSTDQAVLNARVERQMAIANEVIAIIESINRVGEAAGFIPDESEGFRNGEA